MARRTISPFGLFFKWLVIPAGLAAAGYFYVGPHIGKLEEKQKPASQAEMMIEQPPSEPLPPAPDVEISREPASGRRHRR